MDTVVAVLQALGAIAGSLFAFGLILRLLGFRKDLLAAIAGSLAWLILAAYVLVEFGWPLVMPLALFLMLAVGWTVFTFLRYRQARRDELLHVITSAVEAQMPLAPAVRAYMRDSPHRGEGGWDFLLLFLLPAGFFLWHQRHVFDRRIASLADLLDQGVPLSEALQRTRGVAPREVRIAAAVGGTIGRLAPCLRRADRDQLAGAWIEIVPRILYPLLLLLFLGGITTFLMIAIMPRMQRIFADFGEELPALTSGLVTVWSACDDYSGLIALAVFVAIVLAVVVILSPNLRWYLPVLGRLYRWEAQGLVLRMLGALTEAGRPVPESLQLLATTWESPSVVWWCLDNARNTVQRGEPLAPALYGAGLLPASMVPLVQTAEWTHTLPWALTELGDHLAWRAVHLARRVSLVLSPILVAVVGLLVGLIAVGMFVPMIKLLGRLSV